jgi:hypothetical protein
VTTLQGKDVVVALKGGLGNQLFQWAFGAALATRGARVRYDTGLFRGPVGLEIAPILSAPDLVRLPSALLRAQRRVGVLARFSPWTYVDQPGFAYVNPERLLHERRTFLEGYWQSPRYFASVADVVRARIGAWAADELTDEGRATLDAIRSTPDACSVHVRRGDYLEGGVQAVHGVLGADYYRRAMDEARKRGARRFYVFTNDHAWVAAELFDGDVVSVPWSVGTSPVAEIGLMAACAHHVVANSSFSWWGAWLGGADAPTFAPADWFLSPELDASDLVPKHWHRLPNTA